MSINAQYESYRYTGEISRLQSQAVVECRLPGSEVGAVLAVQAQATPTQCVCADGVVKLNGRLLLSVIYEDGNRKICRAERGAEFFMKAENGAVTPACFAKAVFKTENITHRREGSGLYLSVVVGADIDLYGSRSMEYLVGGEGLFTQKREIAVCRTVCVSGESEGTDEFETADVGDILLHTENAVVTRVVAGAGRLDIEGELNLNVCVLKSDESVRTYERLIPFTAQLPCEEAFGTVGASARVLVRSATLTAELNEEKNRAKIALDYALAFDCYLYAKETLSVVCDAFSPCSEITLKKVKEGGRYLTNQVKRTERVGGTAVLAGEIPPEYALEAVVLPRAEAVVKNGEAEGVVTAEVVLKSAEGGYKQSTLSLPFLFPVDAPEGETEVDCLVCGLSVRRRKEGETEAEATLKLCLRVYERTEWEYLSGLEEGAEIEKNDSAVSVYLPRAGEELWQVAKRLGCNPEDLKKGNPGLEFPVKEGERLIVYRQIK